MGYRDEARIVAADTRWTFFRFLPTALAIIIVLAVIGFGLNSAGLIGRTVVEREVFENSYQRKASIAAQIATDAITITQIESRLRNPNLDASVRFNLEAQADAARLRISIARINYQR